MKLSEHFDSEELVCPCCHKADINILLITALEKLRTILQSPIIITSGYRCPKHNKEVGGVSDSQHIKGNAADIKSPGHTPFEIVKACEKIDEFRNCGGVGQYKSWVHVDVRGYRARWGYDQNKD